MDLSEVQMDQFKVLVINLIDLTRLVVLIFFIFSLLILTESIGRVKCQNELKF